MCSFLFFISPEKVNEQSLVKSNDFIKYRGPDLTSKLFFIEEELNFCFFHNLLDISGNSVKQPVLSEDNFTVAMFNGELFNYKKFSQYRSDTDALIDLFQNSDISKLDAEFAVVLLDKKKKEVHFFSDSFLTKPMFWAINENKQFAISSYESALKYLGFNTIHLMKPNSHWVYNYKNNIVEEISNIFSYSLDQYKHSYNDWIEIFIESVRLRALHGTAQPFLSLSSGYDSGAIALALNLLNVKYDTFTITEGENLKILRQRYLLGKGRNHTINSISEKANKKFKSIIKNSIEHFDYHHEDGPNIRNSVKTDQSTLGLAYIASFAKQKGFKVALSGSGSDEIMSDYGFRGNKIYYHSEFGGLFPDNLETIFPWKKFYGDSLRSYLFKDEVVLGHFGIEGRYPFLSRSVVQEFLALSTELKNAHYKAPIKAFFDKYHYPYEEGRKLGFSRVPVKKSWFEF